MAMRKKGMIFTIVAVLLVGVLIASVSLVAKTTYVQKSFVTISRVNTMNDFLMSVDQDAQRNLMISSYRSIISVQRYIAMNGNFAANLTPMLKELVINGSINGTPQDLMANASINDWASRINSEAGKLNINIIITPTGVNAYQASPWFVTIELTANVNMTDFNGLASWNYNKTFTKSIEITSFEDPLYTVKSNNKVTNIITMANITSFVDPTTNDTSALYDHLNNSWYIASSDAPNFLMRFEGNLSASEYGIESLVNIADFSRQNLETYDKSVIDYQYFNDTYDESGDYCSFPDMLSWFRMNSDRLEDYNLTGLGDPC